MYFTLSQRQSLVLIVFGGLVLVEILIVAYWSFRLHLARRDRDETRADTEDFPDGLQQGNQPIPLFLILTIAVLLVWGIGYVVAVALGGLHVQ
jgi:hypothetical protein